MRKASKLTLDPEKRKAALDSIFGDFQTHADPELVKALRECRNYCAEMASFDKPARWLTLLGPSGTGKTMLAKRVARFFERYISCLPDERNKPGEIWTRRGGFVEWVNVVRDMLEGDYSGMTQLRQDWFVALDDIGAEYGKIRELAVSKLFEILNSRVGQWTVITANITLADIGERLDQRIASRLLRDKSTVCNVMAEDYNLR